MRSVLRRWVLQGGLLAASLIVAGFLAEGLCRLVLNPVDYLAVDPVFDPILRVRLEPHAGGHDDWGFRNRDVPEQADIVTLGDSQTYGVGAPAHHSWPAQLAALTGRRVYNLALGGYSPVQYGELLETHALKLRPAVVVVGFYFGNDLWDAHQIVYSLKHWTSLRRPDLPEVSQNPFKLSQPKKFLSQLRAWLARHSVVYRLATSTVLGLYARQLEFEARDDVGSDIVPFQSPVNGVRTAFTPLARLEAENLDHANVREGLRLSLNRLKQMGELCRKAGVHLLVALIPTKERVYEPWIAGRTDLGEHEALSTLLRNEHEANRQLRQFLEKHGVPYLDLEAPMREAAGKGSIYPPDADGHPNVNGYAAIARAVAQTIRPWLDRPAAATEPLSGAKLH
jgi:lysophospholipase L1-like esterase